MQELEKILEEIEQEKLKHWDSSERLETDKLIGWCFDKCADIIRKHMNDGERFEFDFSNVKSFDCQCGRHFVNTGIEEIQQYREIGTVKECRGAVEKQKPQKPKLNYKPRFLGKATYTCPKCGNCCLEEFANERQNNNYCWDCGQAIQWDENLEGMEDD